MNCPFCDNKLIEGTDTCDQCGQPVTELYLRDPATLVERRLLADRIDSLNPKELIGVSPSTTVGETLQLLVSKSIGCVFVVEQDNVVGVFSERDALLRLNVDAAAHRERPISEFMTPNPSSLPADARVAFAVQQMDIGGYRHLPILDPQGRAVGVISVRDILNFLAKQMTTGGAA